MWVYVLPASHPQGLAVSPDDLPTTATMGSIAQQSPETLLSIASKITEYAQQLTKELEAGNVTPVTLEADSPIKYESLPGNSFFIRQQLEDALKDMYILSQGPSESTFNYCHMASTQL